jgi:hypothetical protein
VSVLRTDLNGRLPEPGEKCTLGFPVPAPAHSLQVLRLFSSSKER